MRSNEIAGLRRVWKHQRGNQNREIEGQITQWPNEKGQKYKQRSANHTKKLKIE